MARRYDSEGGMLQLRHAPLGHRQGDVGIELSPDKLDRHVERLEFRQTLGVLDVRIEELRRQLHKRRPRTGLRQEVLADQGTEERLEMGLLSLRKGVQELLL